MSRTTTGQYDEELDPKPLDFVIELVADHQGVDPIDIPSLYRCIDGVLIDRFLRRPPAAGELRFRWAGVTVTLSADRTAEIAPAGDRSDSTSPNGNKASSVQSRRSRSENVTEIRVTTE
jgi:hypothetical protein